MIKFSAFSEAAGLVRRIGGVVLLLATAGVAQAQAPADAAGTAQLALPAGLAAGVYTVRSGANALRLTVE